MRDRRLLTQVLVVNLMLVVAAVVAAALAANPDLTLNENPGAALVLGFAIGLTILVNLFLVQRRFRPLERLVDEMERADLSRPGANLRGAPSASGPEEVERLDRAFRRMLDRLEAERRRTSSAALSAQEEERARIARDLHDEVNQSLTGLLLRLEATRRNAPPDLGAELTETRTLANQAMQELLSLAQQLRPTALDDLGLKAALAGHVSELGEQGELETSFEARGDLSGLPPEVQLVLYRVAQEALSNTIRHSEAKSVRVSLAREDGAVTLTIGDDGRGFTFEQASGGLGLQGMRERALLVGGDLRIESRPERGTRVSLTVPIGGNGFPKEARRDAGDGDD